MTNKNITIEFERRLQVMFPDMIINNKPSTDLILQYINSAIDKFVVTRYTGTNFRNKSFEQDQKRIDDLKQLVNTQTYYFDELDDLEIDGIILPEDYMFLLGETVKIYSNDKCWNKIDGVPVQKSTDVIEATIENIDTKKSNSLSEHRLHANNAKPLRIIEGNNVFLITDGNYNISSYTIKYLRKPSKITINNLSEEYYDLPEYAQHECVNLALSMYLSDKGDNRYNLNQNEISQME